MQHPEITAEIRRLNEIIKSVERQRNEALAKLAHAEAANAILADEVRSVRAEREAKADKAA